MYIAKQPVMALYSAGRTTGLVIESGEGLTYSVPIYEGYEVVHATESMEIAGSNLNAYL